MRRAASDAGFTLLELIDVVDQFRGVNPNTASPDLLAALLLRLGADPEQASRIAAMVAD